MVATVAIVAVVAIIGILGKYCSIVGTGSQMVSHLNPSTVNLYSLIFSVPAVFRSPMRLALRGGHSTSPAVSPSVGGGVGGAGASIGSASVASTPSSTSSGSVLIVCQNNSL